MRNSVRRPAAARSAAYDRVVARSGRLANGERPGFSVPHINGSDRRGHGVRAAADAARRSSRRRARRWERAGHAGAARQESYSGMQCADDRPPRTIDPRCPRVRNVRLQPRIGPAWGARRRGSAADPSAMPIARRRPVRRSTSRHSGRSIAMTKTVGRIPASEDVACDERHLMRRELALIPLVVVEPLDRPGIVDAVA